MRKTPKIAAQVEDVGRQKSIRSMLENTPPAEMRSTPDVAVRGTSLMTSPPDERVSVPSCCPGATGAVTLSGRLTLRSTDWALLLDSRT